MHYEVKQLLGAGKLREAIDFVLRLQPALGKMENLVAIGGVVLTLPRGPIREDLLTSTIDALLHLGDTEHVSELVIALRDSQAAERYAERIQGALNLRRDSIAVV